MLPVFVVTVLALAVVTFVWVSRPTPLWLTHRGKVHLPVAGQTCSGCEHFDLAGGQKVMGMNPAFTAASTHIPPWRMGRVLKSEPNPEYARLTALRDALPEGSSERAVLDAKLDTVPRAQPLPDDAQVPPGMLGLEWQDFGACREHTELRAKSDTCEKWKARP
jgi:hypothetical protein